ncbi:MAG: pantoate kinase [Candidatus Bathyarchaeia archaeon]
MKEAEAFSPGHITGFFQMCDQPNDPLLKGSRGAGVSIARGVTTKVWVEESAKTSVEIMMNGDVTNSALVSEHVAEAFLSRTGGSYKVHVEHDVKVPIGCGFGSSGAGALSLALALNEALNLKLSRLEAAQIAHIAEVECKTGLGTVIAETFGGLEIRVKSGAPIVGKIKSIPIRDGYVVACLSFGPINTSEVLADEVFRQRINEYGGNLVDELVRHPTLGNFIEFSRRFAEHTGLISKRLRAVLEEADSAGLTCSMAMLGETVFTIVRRDQVEEVHKIFNKHAPSERDVIIAEIDFEGARLL